MPPAKSPELPTSDQTATRITHRRVSRLSGGATGITIPAGAAICKHVRKKVFVITRGEILLAAPLNREAQVLALLARIPVEM